MDETPKKGDARRASDEYKERVGGAIRTARTARGLTQAKLASAIGVDVTTVSGIERGENVPSLPVLESIANVLEVSLDDLVRRQFSGPLVLTPPAHDDGTATRSTDPRESVAHLQLSVARLDDTVAALLEILESVPALPPQAAERLRTVDGQHRLSMTKRAS